VSNPLKHGIPSGNVGLEAALLRLGELVDWEKRARGAMRVDLRPELDLCARLGNPERGLLAVHVAGSKGKGTTAALVAESLRAAGVRTGLYTSPHVEHLTERLVLDGQRVSEGELARALGRALDARAAALRAWTPAAEATWFDVVTAAALLLLAEARVEVAVLECGLGGRLDSTNVVTGRVCAVTCIYLEHTAVLGDTRRGIAREKAGIVKPGSVVVVGALGSVDEAADEVEAVARSVGARSVRVTQPEEAGPGERNRRLAAAVLAELVRAEPGLAARLGRNPRVELGPEAALPGRAERRRVGATRVVLDGAHVPESLALVLRDLARDPELAVPPVVVLGLGLEKNARGMLKALGGGVDRVLCTSVGEGPYRGADELASLARELGFAARAVPEARAALDEAVLAAGTGGWVLVTGSLHLVGALRRFTRP
jgi:dihydrofolate synthase/folylpolyglutamate synthase